MNVLRSSYPLFFFIFFLVSPTVHGIDSLSLSSSTDTIINQTCNTCAAKSDINYSFCFSSLQTTLAGIPNADLYILAEAAIAAALPNASATYDTIEKLLHDGGLDSSTLSSLRYCSKKYYFGVGSVVDAIYAISEKNYEMTKASMNVAMNATAKCDDKIVKEEVTSLALIRAGNYALFQLSDLALCILDMFVSSI